MIDASANPTRRHLLGLIAGASLCPRTVIADGLPRLSGRAFGTSWSLLGADPAGIAGLGPALAALFAEIDAEMSPWRAASALSRWNAAGVGWHAAGEEMVRVAGAALALAEASGGAFDPTVGPLVARWGFGPVKGGASPDWRAIAVRGGGIGKARSDLTLDLCGIAKGRALDRAVALVRAHGAGDALIDLGGELRALGHHPDGRYWQVAVEHPVPGRAPWGALRLPPGRAVATSGVRAQSYDLDGVTYGHIIDPRTALPAQGTLRSVTVVAPDAMTADGWATALFAAGAEAGPDLARAHGLSALFLTGPGPVLDAIVTGAIGEVLL